MAVKIGIFLRIFAFSHQKGGTQIQKKLKNKKSQKIAKLEKKTRSNHEKENLGDDHRNRQSHEIRKIAKSRKIVDLAKIT